MNSRNRLLLYWMAAISLVCVAMSSQRSAAQACTVRVPDLQLELSLTQGNPVSFPSGFTVRLTNRSDHPIVNSNLHLTVTINNEHPEQIKQI